MAGDARMSNNEMITLYEMNFQEIFPEFYEEGVRLKGGLYYRKVYIPIEDMLFINPDMEAMIDDRRASVSCEEYKGETECCDPRWANFYPKTADLKPFYAEMAAVDEEFFHPGFSAPSLSKTHEKTVRHRGGKTIHLKKGVSP